MHGTEYPEGRISILKASLHSPTPTPSPGRSGCDIWIYSLTRKQALGRMTDLCLDSSRLQRTVSPGQREAGFQEHSAKARAASTAYLPGFEPLCISVLSSSLLFKASTLHKSN